MKTLALRHELAQLLGFCQLYAEVSLATKRPTVRLKFSVFLHDLAERSLPQARKEFE